MTLSIIEMIFNAGMMVKAVMLTLFFFSLISWSIVITKYLMFRRSSKASRIFLDVFWRCKNLNEAFSAAQQYTQSPEAAVFVTGYNELKKLNASRAGGESQPPLEMQLATMENLKRSVRKAQLLESDRMSKSLGFLATTGSSTPFIGLFGTVWGIMTSFQDIGVRGSASLAVVAPGISEALVATAAGLAVAIPAVIFFNHFSNTVAGWESDIDNFSSDFLNLIERDILSRA
ncbi:protein TolQ [Desulfogranum japonicum]|uniref:protein TolQ n=1 Tax=Desulfogranum japonicum TaxID=231447 RepID=UPI0003FA3D5C|nr:protein TolQ [Desulfogranum japonicum]